VKCGNAYISGCRSVKRAARICNERAVSVSRSFRFFRGTALSGKRVALAC
jgi:hypothetical protein